MTRVQPNYAVEQPRASLAQQDDEDRSSHKRIDADLLIPGRGEPIKNGILIFKPDDSASPNGKIAFAGSVDDVPARFSGLKASVHVPVLMPGLWDCHVHFFGEAEPSLEQVAYTPQSLAGFRSARDSIALLDAGFTSVREVGGYGIDFAKGIDDGWMPGPKIYSAGAPLSQTAGHGDLHTVPLNHLHDCISHGLPLGLADGVDEAIKLVRKQIRRGAKLIKICSTGGVMSRIDSPLAAQFNSAELQAIVDEATRTNLIVASHAHGTAGIIAALNAGVHTIEHGSYLTKQAIDMMLEKDVMLVATRFIQENGLEHPENMPPESYKKLLEIADDNKESYKTAIKAGVRCALGTDLGMCNVASQFNHGMNGREFGYAVQCGMTPLQAVEAGTARGPETLGPQAPLSGQLKEGYDADFIALNHSPLEDIAILAKPKEIRYVWKGGKLFKAPGNPVSFM
ncbi:hypothetical protein HII31_12541 [Pseudocercospora fuligena]|uniref:Amidohydrolase-related domain-containing protein n=1 Tax=Pseudocercospora fuligena TaxID=685502 RepID=A0A8H6R9U2_9PEZI|nr:hypothetical protein HII31_12541 [Pseudocercospora fuligena]